MTQTTQKAVPIIGSSPIRDARTAMGMAPAKINDRLGMAKNSVMHAERRNGTPIDEAELKLMALVAPLPADQLTLTLEEFVSSQDERHQRFAAIFGERDSSPRARN